MTVNGRRPWTVAGALILSVLAAAGLTVTELDCALTSIGAVNSRMIVSALSSVRFVNVAMPPEAVTVVVPSSGPVPTRKRDGHLGRVVADDEIAGLVFDVNHRLGGERLTGRGARRGLRVKDELVRHLLARPRWRSRRPGREQDCS